KRGNMALYTARRALIKTASALAAATAAPNTKAQEGPIILDDIVIQGEKSGRTLAETSASTVVLNGAEVDNPRNLDVSAVADGVPNVVFDDSALFPAIRGIDGSAGQLGAVAFTTGAQPRVNIIVDGVARPANVGAAAPAISSLWDVEQVEIARGPQSTLGGRNSLAGNIRIATADPTFEFEGAVRGLGFTQDGTIGAAGMLNIPLVDDQLALRVTAEATDGESFINVIDPAVAADRSEIEDEEYRRFRAKLLFVPEAVPGLEIVAAVERSELNNLFEQEADFGSDGFDLSNFAVVGSNNDNEQTVLSLKGVYALSDNIEFEASAAYLDNDFRIPPTNPTFDFEQETESVSAEALLRIEGIGFVNRAVFGFAFERQTEVGVNDAPALAISLDGEIVNYGIFGEIEFGLTDRLALIAGGRIEIDDRDRVLDVFGTAGTLDISETAFIPKLGVRYEVTDELTIGYQYTEGFRAGGIDFDLFDPSAGAVTYDSETLRQHEIYLRSRFLRDRAALNVSAFYYEFDDVQLSGAGGPGPSGLFDLFGNAPRAEGFGVEVEGAFEVTDWITVTGAIGLLDTEITDPGPELPEFQGAELPRAPNLTFSAGVSYVSDFGLDASATVRHVGEQSAFLGDDPVPSYTVVDLSAGYTFEVDERRTFRIEAFVNNVIDERIVLSADAPNSETVGRPRTFGLGGTFRF
ncbi:MAG: TonB-dependent receptor, partial [Pseudomonadota bacterium]